MNTAPQSSDTKRVSSGNKPRFCGADSDFFHAHILRRTYIRKDGKMIVSFAGMQKQAKTPKAVSVETAFGRF